MYPPSTTDTWRAELIEWAPRIAIALVIILATWAVARAVKWALAKAISRSPALQRHTSGSEHETVGQQIGTIAKLLVWLVGIMAALNFLQIGQILAPVNTLTSEIFAFLPRLIGAGLIFFVGLIVARIVRRLVETVLTAANIDGFMARAGLGDHPPTVRQDPAAVPPGAAPGATRASLARAAGILVFALIIIPVAIAALQVLGIEAISGPAINMLDEISAAIPRLLTAALWLGIAFVAAKFLKTIIEAILPPTGFDDALRSTGVLPVTTVPSRIVANIAFVAIMLAAAIEAAHQLGGDTVAVFLIQVTELGSKVIFGTLIIVAGIFLARILSKLVGSSTGEGGFAQTMIRYAIIALFTAIGLTFMGLADVIVYMAFGLILGAGAIATALAFGLGGREAAGRILNHYADRVTGPRPPTAPPRRPARLEGTKETPTGDGGSLI
ncbi:hypothetical protein GGQ97_002621 [Sphingomonas kaistensis]|uniref:Small-conductance mechanosensitive channel n=1 Tax=Sphingomonas kaistensis TaxID=298708 RepID=A0A7X5Y8L7_9SPHN|nr:mechanosensitive ion channel [Sphingomonas kaistensis]NJC06828.1 hypothetical protein [Sphingomonas kaistensis]